MIKLLLVILTLITTNKKAYGFFELIRAKEKIAESTLLLDSIADLGNEVSDSKELELLKQLSKELKDTRRFIGDMDSLSAETQAVLMPYIRRDKDLSDRINHITNYLRRAKRLRKKMAKLYGIVHPSAIVALEQKETNEKLASLTSHIKEQDALRQSSTFYKAKLEALRKKQEKEFERREFETINKHAKANGTSFFKPYRIKVN